MKEPILWHVVNAYMVSLQRDGFVPYVYLGFDNKEKAIWSDHNIIVYYDDGTSIRLDFLDVEIRKKVLLAIVDAMHEDMVELIENITHK